MFGIAREISREYRKDQETIELLLVFICSFWFDSNDLAFHVGFFLQDIPRIFLDA